MATEPACSGARLRIEYAKLRDGTIPAKDFLGQQEQRWQARIYSLFQRLAEFGQIHNQEQFKKIGADFWEFKAFQIRMICYFRPGGRVIVTHGFIKKKDALDKNELRRAEAIRAECERI